MLTAHVLIVEDHEADRTLLKMRLERNGYRVTAAGDGLEALAAARRDRPDAIVSDVLMPNMDGFALCRAWMQDAGLKTVPFIFYSVTYNRPEDEHFAMALGAVRYLIKPLKTEEFLRELRAVLQQWAGHAASATASPLDDASSNALHQSALLRKLQDKISELEMANRELQASEARYRQLFEANPHPMWFFDPETLAFLAVNDAAVALYGWSREEFLTMTLTDIRSAEALPALLKHLASDNEKRIRTVDSSQHRKKDGTLIDVEISSHIVEFGGRRARIVSAYDITARNLAERALARESHRNQAFLRNASDGVHIIDADGNVMEVSDSFCRMLGYSREELIGANVSLWDAQWSPQELKQEIAEQIAKEGRSVLETTHRRRDGSFLDVEITGQGLQLEGKPVLFNSARDISEKKRAEEEIRRYVEQLKTAFMSTVEVATIISEMRDPYTTGHERRVAALAVAIGAELGFDARRQEGLQVAGHLHDIGKMTIPAEILSKPGKLSAIEFQLVQGHAMASYGVLKGVEFPWPVAQVALQHHERMDGSGYPQGLKGEAILLEARIIAVADVVEAISSHRPYRPGLGIDKALAEIERGRGTAYDTDVADACLRLFREKRHQLPP